MTGDMAAAFLAVPLTLLFGCLAIFIVSDSRRIHDDPDSRPRPTKDSERSADRLRRG